MGPKFIGKKILDLQGKQRSPIDKAIQLYESYCESVLFLIYSNLILWHRLKGKINQRTLPFLYTIHSSVYHSFIRPLNQSIDWATSRWCAQGLGRTPSWSRKLGAGGRQTGRCPSKMLCWCGAEFRCSCKCKINLFEYFKLESNTNGMFQIHSFF